MGVARESAESSRIELRSCTASPSAAINDVEKKIFTHKRRNTKRHNKHKHKHAKETAEKEQTHTRKELICKNQKEKNALFVDGVCFPTTVVATKPSKRGKKKKRSRITHTNTHRKHTKHKQTTPARNNTNATSARP